MSVPLRSTPGPKQTSASMVPSALRPMPRIPEPCRDGWLLDDDGAFLSTLGEVADDSADLVIVAGHFDDHVAALTELIKRRCHCRALASDCLTRPRSDIEDDDSALSALEEHSGPSARPFRRNNPTFITCALRIKFHGPQRVGPLRPRVRGYRARWSRRWYACGKELLERDRCPQWSK
jgi:hypothetical protein